MDYRCTNEDHDHNLAHGLECVERGNAVLAAKVAKSASEAKTPTRAYSGDAGFDLYFCGDRPFLVRPNEVVTVPSRVAIQLPEGMWGLVIGRSSSFARGLIINPTVIDGGFRGDLFAYARNINRDWVTIEPNDRLAQFIPMPLLADGMEMVEVDALDTSDRGTAGFGSSGR